MWDDSNNIVYWILVSKREDYSAIWTIDFNSVLSLGVICLVDLVEIMDVGMKDKTYHSN
jgi:hypothetical protein